MRKTLRCLPLLAVALLGVLTGCETPQDQLLMSLPKHELDMGTPAAPPSVSLWRPAPPIASRPVPAPAPAARPMAAPTGPLLTPEEKAWYVPPVAGRPWRHIVVHHSATAAGNAAVFDAAHRARGWDELGYHFVIDNGDGGADGQVEVGSRWRKQKQGAHCGGTPDNEFNEHGIGICLVGSFGWRLPSAAQLASLERLVTFLVRTYDVTPAGIVGHCDCPNAATKCPGAAFKHYLLTTFPARVSARVAAAPAGPGGAPG